MKRPFIILLAGVIGIAAILYFRPKPSVVNEQVATPQPIQTNIAPVLVAKNPQIEIITQTPRTIIATTEPKKPLDVLKAQSLADWTNAIPNIKLWSHFRTRSSWVSAPMDTDTNSQPILLLTGLNGNQVLFTAGLTDVEAVGDHVRRIEIHSVWMNIADTKLLGDSLLELMGKDKIGFDEWCAKVGNNWVDAPLYSSGNARLQNSDKYYAFGTHITFNNEKPWFINFVITDP